MRKDCDNCRFRHDLRFEPMPKACEKCVSCVDPFTRTTTDPSEWLPSTEAQKLADEMQKRTTNLFGDITTGYTYKEKENNTMPPKTNYSDLYLSADGRRIGRSHVQNIINGPQIKNVIFNYPATIVFWSDNTKTVVKCDGEVWDPEKGLAMAITKKFMGTNKSQSNYCDIFKKWCQPEEELMDEKRMSAAEYVKEKLNEVKDILGMEE